MAAPEYLREVADGVTLQVLVQPRASRTKLVGAHDGRLKVALAAPPVDGEANAALVEFLAKLTGLPRRSLEITAGQTGRRKTVLLRGASLVGVSQALQVNE
jgi:hypothetical protein